MYADVCQHVERKTSKMSSCILCHNIFRIRTKYTKYYLTYQIFLWKFVCLEHAKHFLQCPY